MVELEQWIARCRRRIALKLGLRSAVTALSVWLFVWGTSMLVLRGALGMPRGLLLWGLLGIPVAFAVGMAIGWRRRPGSGQVRALLDHRWGCGGLLMAAAESDCSSWPITPDTVALPGVTWNARRPLMILGSCLLLTAVAWLLPERALNPNYTPPLQLGPEVDRLARTIDLLKEERIVPPERAQSLEQSLEQLEREAAGNDPGKTWEALDHLEQSLAQAGAEAAENAAQQARAAASAEELAAAMDQVHDQLSPDQLAEAMHELSRDLAEVLAENEQLAQDLPESLKQQLAKGELDPAELARLSEKLGQCKAGQLSKMKTLSEARLIDASKLDKLCKECQGDPRALAELLAKCEGAGELKLCLGGGSKPGRGGISRGRGDAAMTWTDSNSDAGVAFKEQVLPTAAVTSLQDARLQGVSSAAPQTSDPQVTTAGGVLSEANAGSGAARTQVILPEHKKVVQRYFDRLPKSSSETP